MTTYPLDFDGETALLEIHSVIPEQIIDWDEIEESLTDEGYENWKDKREQDVKYCGYLKYTENPKTGINSATLKLCGEPDCPYCGPKIREDMLKALSEYTKERPLRKVTLTGDLDTIKKERARIMRKYGGKDKVSCFANDILTEDGLKTEIEILIDTDEEIGEAYTQPTIEDVERWASKSYNSSKSGNLHKLKKAPAVVANDDKEDDPFDLPEKVVYEEWVIDTQYKNEVNQVEREVIQETGDLDPQSFDELKEYMQIRRELRKKKLQERNIVILSKELLYMTLKMSEVRWKFKPKE